MGRVDFGEAIELKKLIVHKFWNKVIWNLTVARLSFTSSCDVLRCFPNFVFENLLSVQFNVFETLFLKEFFLITVLRILIKDYRAFEIVKRTKFSYSKEETVGAEEATFSFSLLIFNPNVAPFSANNPLIISYFCFSFFLLSLWIGVKTYTDKGKNEMETFQSSGEFRVLFILMSKLFFIS